MPRRRGARDWEHKEMSPTSSASTPEVTSGWWRQSIAVGTNSRAANAK